MIGIRKICINSHIINDAQTYNNQLAFANDRFTPRARIPNEQYETVQFSFRPHNVENWFVEPDSKDIIVWLRNRGEVRFEYDALLETQLGTIFSV